MAQGERIWALEFGDAERPLQAYTAGEQDQASAAAAENPEHAFFDSVGRPLALRDGSLKRAKEVPADAEVRALVRAALRTARATGKRDLELLGSNDLGAYESLQDFDRHRRWLLAAPSAAELIGALHPALFPENETSRRRLCKLFRTC